MTSRPGSAPPRASGGGGGAVCGFVVVRSAPSTEHVERRPTAQRQDSPCRQRHRDGAGEADYSAAVEERQARRRLDSERTGTGRRRLIEICSGEYRIICSVDSCIIHGADDRLFCVPLRGEGGIDSFSDFCIKMATNIESGQSNVRCPFPKV